MNKQWEMRKQAALSHFMSLVKEAKKPNNPNEDQIPSIKSDLIRTVDHMNPASNSQYNTGLGVTALMQMLEMGNRDIKNNGGSPPGFDMNRSMRAFGKFNPSLLEHLNMLQRNRFNK